MGALEIGVEELMPQKKYYKNDLDCTGASQKTYCSGTSKKSWEELNIELALNI